MNNFAKYVNYYRENGNVKIRNILSNKEVSNIKNAYSLFLKKKNLFRNKSYGKIFSYLKKKDRPTSLHNLQNFKKLFFYKIARKKKLNLIADKLVGSKTKMFGIQFFIKNKEANLPTSPHQDNAYWCYKNFKGLSFWISLQNTNKNNGCLYYYEKSHFKDLPHYKNSFVPGTTYRCKAPKKLKKKHYSLKTGDCVVHSSRSVHASYKNNSNKDRIAFIVTFVERNAKKDPIMFKKYKENYNKVIKANLKKFN